MFYDHESCRLDGKTAIVMGLEVVKSNQGNDICYMMCVTHDEALAERIKCAWRCWRDGLGEPLDLCGLDFMHSSDIGLFPTLIVAHPHGQPKKITLGDGRYGETTLLNYNAATCPCSSGAPVFWFHTRAKDRRYYLWFPPVHSGSFTGNRNLLYRLKIFLQKFFGRETNLDQVNYGNWWFKTRSTD